MPADAAAVGREAAVAALASVPHEPGIALPMKARVRRGVYDRTQAIALGAVRLRSP